MAENPKGLIARRWRPCGGVAGSGQIDPSQPSCLQILVLRQPVFSIFAAPQANDTGGAFQVMLVRNELSIADGCCANLKVPITSAIPSSTQIDGAVDSTGP